MACSSANDSATGIAAPIEMSEARAWSLSDCVGKYCKSFVRMPADQWMTASSDDEIDLREVFAALRRRWRWIVGSCFLGLALAGGAVSLKSRSAPQVQASLFLDVARIPSCALQQRQVNAIVVLSSESRVCPAEVDRLRLRLNQLAKNFDQVDYKVDRLAFDVKGRDLGAAQLVLTLTSTADRVSEVSSALAQIQQQMNAFVVGYAQVNSDVDSDWILVEEPSNLVFRETSSHSLALGLLGGLVVGAGSGLIADRRSNLVYSREELLRRLNYPLHLSLPAAPWSASAVEVLVGQLSTLLDHNLSWRVLSIARQHEAVEPLTQLLQQQGGTELQCSSADPLLTAVLRTESSDRPTGLLLVVEPGFNSARALEEARLLISQMSSVQAVGVVLIGAPLPEELSSSVVG